MKRIAQGIYAFESKEEMKAYDRMILIIGIIVVLCASSPLIAHLLS